MIGRDPSGERHPWALNAFVMAMFAGLALIGWTAFDTLHLSDDALYPLDAWLAIMVVAVLWGIHNGPEGLRREWFGKLLAYLSLVWIPFGFVTAFGTLEGPPEMGLLLARSGLWPRLP